MRYEMMVGFGLVFSVVLLSGCGREAKQAQTPQEALGNLHAALVDGDLEAFLDCFETPSDDHKQALEAKFRFELANREFEQAMKKAYNEEPSAPEPIGSNAWLEGANFSAADENNGVYARGAARLALVKKGDGWLIKAADFLATGQKMDEPARLRATEYRQMAEALAQVRRRIGKGGYDARKIRRELSEAELEVRLQSARDKQ